MPATNDTFTPETPTTLSGDAILAQVSPEISGSNNRQLRPSDVRLLLRTADLDGQTYKFPNFGLAENEMSTVPFTGEDAIVVMPKGKTPREQLASAAKIVDALAHSGQSRVTPEFMQASIVNEDGPCHDCVAQAYGPAPFKAQADRFVDVAIPAADGKGVETIKPQITDNYAEGMRAPAEQEAYLVVCDEGIVVQSPKINAQIKKFHEPMLKGRTTAAEQMDGMFGYGIVIARDAADHTVKPLRVSFAREVFNIPALPILKVDRANHLLGQYKPVYTPAMSA